MPRNTDIKLLLIKKQKRLIDSRLMQISLMVDDYIYNNIPISTENAQLYIKEVTGYQDKCLNDLRSLQVIEKLVQCMKGIMEEQQELKDFNNVVILADDENLPPSPIDEDLTQLSQEIEEMEMVLNQTESQRKNTTQYNDKSITEQAKIEKKDVDDFTKKVKTKGFEVINKDLEIINLHRAISEMSIQEGDALSAKSDTYGECSQSVLVNFDIGNNNKANNKIVVNDPALKQFKETVHFPKESNNTSPNRNATGKNTRKRKLLNVLTMVNDAADIRTTEFTADSIDTNTVLAEVKPKRKPRKISRRVKKEKDVKTKQTRKKNGKTIRKDTELKTLILVKSNDIKEESINIKTMARKLNLTDDAVCAMPAKTIKNHSPINAIKISAYKNDTAPNKSWNTTDLLNQKNTFTEKATIYNQEVVNDLSWIEDIRYVREISEEENLPINYEDNFWNDYTLPNDWNDFEFM